jgi:hypothetical protein
MLNPLLRARQQSTCLRLHGALSPSRNEVANKKQAFAHRMLREITLLRWSPKNPRFVEWENSCLLVMHSKPNVEAFCCFVILISYALNDMEATVPAAVRFKFQREDPHASVMKW